MAQLQYDVVIVGASFGGVAAALAAADDSKVRVALLEPSAWVGGQATSQGVTRWDEEGISLIETSGTAKSYQDLRNAIRDWYRNNAGLSSYGESQQYFNPGFADPDYPFAADPSIVQKVMLEKIASLAPRLTLKLGASVTGVSVQNGAVAGLTVVSDGATDTYTARVYIDATDLGDLLPLAGLPWKI